jgi:hypothetical protein
LAVGSEGFVTVTKESLGIKVKGREVIGVSTLVRPLHIRNRSAHRR